MLLSVVMLPSMSDAQERWLNQLATMRKAIADLNLPAEMASSQPYGHDFDLDDEQSSAGSGSDDVWDIISDEFEEVYSGDQADFPIDHGAASNTFDERWLQEKCAGVARASSHVDAPVLQEHVTAVLASDSSGESRHQQLYI